MAGKKILIIYTGGTICTTLGEDNIKSVNLKAARALPIIYKSSASPYAKKVKFHNGRFLGVLSENMTISKWNTLIKYFINYVLPKIDEYSGIIVTHGTDTLAFSSSLFSVLLKGIKIPVFFVSSNEQLLTKDEKLNHRANGNDNFAVAVECICKGISAGVYVPYKNIGDDKVLIHKGERLEQCKIYSENFYSANPIAYTPEIEFSKNNEDEIAFSDELLIERFRDINLKDCVLKIEPYVGLNYSRFNFKGIRAVLHSTYHSGTACVIKTEKRETYTNASILNLLDRCKKLGIDLYYSPSKVGEDADMYDSVPLIQNHNNRQAKFFYGTTNELLYAKLLIAYSLGLSTEERELLLKISKTERVD